MAGAAVAVTFTQFAGAAVVGVSLFLATAWAIAGRRSQPALARGLAMVSAIYLAALLSSYFIYASPQVRRRGTGGPAFDEYFASLKEPATIVPFVAARTGDLLTMSIVGGPIGPRWRLLVAAVVAPILLTGGVSLARGGRRGKFAAATLVTTVAVFVAMAFLGAHPFGGIRHCLPLTPLLFVVVGAGLATLASSRSPMIRAYAGVGCLMVGSLMVFGLVRVAPGANRFQVGSVVGSLRGRVEVGDRIAAVGWFAPPALVARPPGNLDAVASVCGAGSGAWRGDDLPVEISLLLTQDLSRIWTEFAAGLAPQERIWIIYTSEMRARVQTFRPDDRFQVVDEVAAPGCWATCWQCIERR